MSATLFGGPVLSVLASVVFSASVVSFSGGKTVCSFLHLLGAGCLLAVGLCHVCEGLHLFPRMHWGFQGSLGHYLDFYSCLLGVTLFPAGFIGRRLFHSIV
jgi:hypothetical protein